VCVELGEELLGHLVDLIAEDVLLLGSVSAANAGERRLPRTVEGLRRLLLGNSVARRTALAKHCLLFLLRQLEFSWRILPPCHRDVR
jgi:hypothetical protein